MPSKFMFVLRGLIKNPWLAWNSLHRSVLTSHVGQTSSPQLRVLELAGVHTHAHLILSRVEE